MAIIERRTIEFDAEGLLKAVVSTVHLASRFSLPSSGANGATFHPEQNSVHLLFGTGSSARVVPLAAEVLGALLVSFCRAERVPLPRSAMKSVQVKPSTVVLRFTMKVGHGRPPKLARSMSWGTS